MMSFGEYVELCFCLFQSAILNKQSLVIKLAINQHPSTFLFISLTQSNIEQVLLMSPFIRR